MRCLAPAIILLGAMGNGAAVSAQVPVRSHGICKLKASNVFLGGNVEWTYDGSYATSSATLDTGSGKAAGKVANLRGYNDGKSYQISLRFEHPDKYYDRAEISIFPDQTENGYRLSMVEFARIDGDYFVQVSTGYQPADCVVLDD